MTREDLSQLLLSATQDQFEDYRDLFRDISESRANRAKNTFSIGEQVSFVAKGIKRTGQITKKMKKNIEVRVSMEDGRLVNWKVFPGFLTSESRSTRLGLL
jgi:hypothetical protein